ncbi:RagB/SusD family nutrient uptake outer membrane protein [Parafilimonas sp.]|uniref:RagB/SusD family nutrient uptake outer membrane protein n=1 Tax=Parafilimonas sp. TaxID=1969739 RepID=UPI0039E2AE66
MKSKYFLILLVVTGLTSCKKFLDLTPNSQMSDNEFYNNQNDFERALLGAYSNIRDLYSGSAILYAADLRTDNAEINWSSPSTDEMQMEQNALTSSNGYVNSIWNTCLKTISKCNTILNRIEGVDFAEADKNKIIGETKFLRALSFFYMVQLFGEVPVTFEEFTNPEEILAADLTRKPVDEVYNVIIDDLTSAESLLPATLNSDKTRASIGTVKTLLGKVYLTRGNYDLAAAKLKEVIDLGQYKLHDDYASLFSLGNNNLDESIFEIQFVSGKSLGNNYSAVFTPAITSMALFPGNAQGSGRITPTLNMFNTYETGDERKAASVNDSVPLIDGTKSYSRYALKFVDWEAVSTSDGAVTFTVLRYADVLLMHAEALNNLDKTAEALVEINLVRQRAGLPGLTGLDKAATALALERERRVEFMFEGHRWFDLLRTGRLRDVVNAYYVERGLGFAIEPYETLFPVPLSEIQLNSDLTQNEGY